MNKCDSCGKFGEVETVTVEIKKHKECDINGAFGVKQEVITKIPLDLPREELPPAQLIPNKVAPYIGEELKKML